MPTVKCAALFIDFEPQISHLWLLIRRIVATSLNTLRRRLAAFCYRTCEHCALVTTVDLALKNGLLFCQTLGYSYFSVLGRIPVSQCRAPYSYFRILIFGTHRAWHSFLRRRIASAALHSLIEARLSLSCCHPLSDPGEPHL